MDKKPGKWVPIETFWYEKRPYHVLFENSMESVVCWPNAGCYHPFSKENNEERRALGKPLLIWDGVEGSDYISTLIAEMRAARKEKKEDTSNTNEETGDE